MAARKRKRELITLYEAEGSQSTTQEEPKKKKKTDDDIPQPEERAAFFKILEEEYIKCFLARDSCFKISDKYLLAIVFTFFRRAGLHTAQYGTFFFPAL
ncbi:speedy protein 1-B-like [Anomaloglossus baeobatrachus]